VNDSASYVRLPHTLSTNELLTVPTEPLHDDQFAACEREFVRHLFGYSEYLRQRACETPVSDAFLSVFVMLLEVLNLNAPPEARRCVSQLKQILQVTLKLTRKNGRLSF
jgi:hypothetical protein